VVVALILQAGAAEVTAGATTPGNIMAAITYTTQLLNGIMGLTMLFQNISRGFASWKRVKEVICAEPQIKDGPFDGQTETHGKIEFRNVSFSYSGSGKTTVVNLLMRFYDVDSGSIRIDVQDIADISRQELRKNVAIVLQDTVLFSDTVQQNLQYANENATMEQLEQAAQMSRCKDMIHALPQGYDTMLEAGGANISQEQRQLLAIARAFVADPKILIMDEATSNVDTRTEKVIQSAMQKIMENRTSIVIAHRLSTIRDSDLIVVMDQGRIVEQGTHEELLARQGKYYTLYMTQFSGFAT
jgi:ATP-binding cassette, subfamily B, bacterial